MAQKKHALFPVFIVLLLIPLAFSCSKEKVIRPIAEVSQFQIGEVIYPLTIVNWLCATNDFVYVPELKESKIFKTDENLNVLKYIDLRDAFESFEIGHVGISDSILFVYNRSDNKIYTFTHELLPLNEYNLPICRIGLCRVHFFNTGFISTDAKAIIKYEFNQRGLHESIIGVPQKPRATAHYAMHQDYVYSISEEKPIIEVIKDSIVVSYYDYSKQVTSIDKTMKAIEQALEGMKSNVQYILVRDAVLNGSDLFLLLNEKKNPDISSINTILRFSLLDDYIKLKESYRIKSIERIRSITLCGNTLIATGDFRNGNSVSLFKIAP